LLLQDEDDPGEKKNVNFNIFEQNLLSDIWWAIWPRFADKKMEI
jgi:hypothetical protein